MLGALVLALLAAGVRIALSSRMHRRPPPVQHPVEDEIPGHPTPEKIGPVASVHIDFNIPSARVQELKTILGNISEAYEKEQYEVARRRLAEVPDDIFTLSADPREEVFLPLLGTFHDNFMFRYDEGMLARPLRDFAEVTAFTSYMRLNFELARFFNDAGDFSVEKLGHKADE